MNTGLSRIQTDKFYTKDAVVDLCLDLWNEKISVKDDHIVIEPSASSGAFSDKLIKHNLTAYDIEPGAEDKGILKRDYLKLDISQFSGKSVHVIGNPPFGRQSSLARKFIEKSCEFAPSISFILPNRY